MALLLWMMIEMLLVNINRLATLKKYCSTTLTPYAFRTLSIDLAIHRISQSIVYINRFDFLRSIHLYGRDGKPIAIILSGFIFFQFILQLKASSSVFQIDFSPK